MAEQQVRIIALDEHSVTVEGRRSGGCSACAQRDQCATGMLQHTVQQQSDPRRFQLRLPKPQSGEPLNALTLNNELTLRCDDRLLLSLLSRLFLPPLLAMIAGLALVMACAGITDNDGLAQLLQSDAAQLGAVLGGLIVGAWISHRRLQHYLQIHPLPTPELLASVDVGNATKATKPSAM